MTDDHNDYDYGALWPGVVLVLLGFVAGVASTLVVLWLTGGGA